MSILNGLQRFRWFQGLRVLLIASTLAGILALDLSGELTIRAAALAYAGAYLVTALVSTAVVLRASWGTIRVRRATVRSLLSFGFKSQLSTTMWALNERADQLVISVFLSSASLGLYVVAVTLTSLTTLIGFSFALVALPILARVASRSERLQTTRAIVTATIVCGVAVSIPILIAEPLIVEVLFGSGFEDSIGVGRVLLLAAMVFGLNRVLEAILQAEGQASRLQPRRGDRARRHRRGTGAAAAPDGNHGSRDHLAPRLPGQRRLPRPPDGPRGGRAGCGAAHADQGVAQAGDRPRRHRTLGFRSIAFRRVEGVERTATTVLFSNVRADHLVQRHHYVAGWLAEKGDVVWFDTLGSRNPRPADVRRDRRRARRPGPRRAPAGGDDREVAFRPGPRTARRSTG